MRIEIDRSSEAKLEGLLELLSTQYDLEDLTAEELVDALLDLGAELLLTDEPSMSITKTRLIGAFGGKVAPRPS